MNILAETVRESTRWFITLGIYERSKNMKESPSFHTSSLYAFQYNILCLKIIVHLLYDEIRISKDLHAHDSHFLGSLHSQQQNLIFFYVVSSIEIKLIRQMYSLLWRRNHDYSCTCWGLSTGPIKKHAPDKGGYLLEWPIGRICELYGCWLGIIYL